jgi:hypothetical protein
MAGWFAASIEDFPLMSIVRGLLFSNATFPTALTLMKRSKFSTDGSALSMQWSTALALLPILRCSHSLKAVLFTMTSDCGTVFFPLVSPRPSM